MSSRRFAAPPAPPEASRISPARRSAMLRSRRRRENRVVYGIRHDHPPRRGTLAWHQLAAPFLAPYLERDFDRALTPAVSRAARTILYRTPGRSFTLPPRTSTIECS